MGRNKTVIPKAPMARILMKAGAERVSADAAEELSEVMTGIAEEIGRMAVKIAKHSGRKTVHDSDIKLAANQ